MIFKIFKVAVCCICFCGFFLTQSHSMQRDDVEISFVRTAVAAGVGMIVDRTLFYPVDFTVTQKQFQSHSVSGIVGKVLREEGASGFFRGYRYQLLSALPISGVFALNDQMYRRLQGNSLQKEFISGVTSALLFSAVYNPFDLRRVWQVTHKCNYKPTHILDNYRGLYPQFTRAFLYSLSISGTRYLSHQDSVFPADLNPTLKYLLGGLLPGCIAQVCMSPVDLIKTRVMADKEQRGPLFHAKNVVREGALCDGMLLRVLRHGPATGLIMGVMKFVEQLLLCK